MSEDFEIKVPIKDELRKDLVFGLGARPANGLILGFCGYHHQVMETMQGLSHGTRAYVVNADGLPGFVQKFDIVRHLREADEAGQLVQAR